MGSWNSKDGIFVPARERVAYFDKDGMPQIYDGPDRSATQYLKETGEVQLGTHFLEHPENIERAHEKKMTVEQFTKTDVNTKEKREKAFKEAEAKVNTHLAPKRTVNTEKMRSGGDNTASGGAGSLVGGMGDGDPITDAISSVGKKK